MAAMQGLRNGRTPSSLRRLAFVVALFSASSLFAQQALSPQAPAPTSTMRATTHLVLVDVVVHDKHGDHVTNLTANDFTIRDRGKPQTITVFSDDHAGGTVAKKTSPPPPLPPDVFTNRPEYHRPEGPPTIVLMDSLNTAVGDQLSAHAAMLQYLRTQSQNSQEIAILSLNESLALLQDFTSDSRLLIAALDKSNPNTSSELSGMAIHTLTAIEAANLRPETRRILDQQNQTRAAESTDTRVRITLEALRSIARAVSGIPGRKNLIWVSSAFPFSLQPDIANFPDAQRDYGEDIRHTASLLASARVAFYTVDARGLMVGDVTERRLGTSIGATVQTIQNSANPRSPEDQLANSPDAIIGSHATMDDLAKETGGLAFYNNNDIMQAVARSAADGGRYYTLGYYPEGASWDGKFHNIEVKIARNGVKPRYRSGYFAVDPAHTSASDTPEQRDRRAYNELRAALAAPLPATEVTFRLHVPVFATGLRPQVQIQLLMDASTISFDSIESDLHHCNLDFMAAAVSSNGKVVASDAHTADVRLKPAQFAQTNQGGLPFFMQLSLSPGTYSLRVAVRDNRTGLIGTLTVPLAVPAP